MCIVVEEADETLFWIEMMVEAGFISMDQFKAIENEGFEILKVMSAFKKRVESNL
ncbi:MAG: four helix bundle protein [Saprospiraceae bacterium]